MKQVSTNHYSNCFGYHFFKPKSLSFEFNIKLNIHFLSNNMHHCIQDGITEYNL